MAVKKRASLLDSTIVAIISAAIIIDVVIDVVISAAAGFTFYSAVYVLVAITNIVVSVIYVNVPVAVTATFDVDVMNMY